MKPAQVEPLLRLWLQEGQVIAPSLHLQPRLRPDLESAF